jgi:hypothetical protein
MHAIFFKLSPLLGHPHVKTYALFEHVMAFSVLGFLFFLAFPNRPLFVGFGITIGAVVLEYLKNFTPDRHASVLDATEKIVGGLLGIIIANVAVGSPKDIVVIPRSTTILSGFLSAAIGGSIGHDHPQKTTFAKMREQRRARHPGLSRRLQHGA